jgi:ribonuclease P protein component
LRRFSFPKTKRLAGNRQFKAVLARNIRVSNGLLTLFVAENNCGYPRFGVSVGKACGKAVVRNRLKRLVREAFRQSQRRIPPDFDYLFVIAPQSSKNSQLPAVDYKSVKASFLVLVSDAVRRIEWEQKSNKRKNQ